MSWLALSRRGANLPNPPRVTYPPLFLLQTPALPSDASGSAGNAADLCAHSDACSCDNLRVIYPFLPLLRTSALPPDASGRAATVAALRAHSAARSCDVLRAPAREFDFPAYTSRAALTFTIPL